MATNPLSVPVTGGTPEPYVAGLGVQAPRITGAPIAAPSNISEILALLNGTAQTVVNTNEIRLQSERRTKQEMEDVDRSDLNLLQKESELWKVMAENDPIVLHSKPFADHLDKLKAEADDAKRSPFYQAQAASYLANSTAFKQNTLYTQQARSEAAIDKQEADARRIEADARRHAAEIKQDRAEGDQHDLDLLNKQVDLWKTKAESDPNVLRTDGYKDLLSSLKVEASKDGRSTHYQARVADLLSQATTFKYTKLYTTQEREEAQATHRAAQIKEAADVKARNGRQLGDSIVSEIEVKVAEAEANGMPPSEILTMIDKWGIERGAKDSTEATTKVVLYRNTVAAKQYKELHTALKEAADNQYINDAGDLQGLPLTIMNEKTNDPEKRGKALTQFGHSVSGIVDPVVNTKDYSAPNLSAVFTKLNDVDEAVKSVPNQTLAQQDFANRALSISSAAKEKILQGFSNDVMDRALANINNFRRNEDVPQEAVPKFVADVVNEELGIKGAVSYTTGEGYTSSIAEFRSMMPRLDALTERINDEMKRDAPEREAMQRLIGTFKSAAPSGKGVTPANTGSPNNSNEVSIPEETPGGGEPLDTGVNPSMVPPKLHEIQPMAVVDDATLRLAKFNPNTVPIDTLRYVISRYPKGTDLGYFKPTVEKFVSNPLLPNGEFNKDGYERTMAILNGTQYGRSIAIQGYDGLSEPKTIRLIKTAIWGNLRHLATSGDPADAGAAKLAKGIIGNSEDKNSYQSYMAWMDTPQNPAGSVKNNDVELDFGKTLKNTYGGKLIASPALKDILQAADMAAGKDNPKYKEDTDESRLLQRETHKVLLQSLGISLVDSGTSVRAIRDTYGHAPSNPQKTLDAVLALKPDWSSPMHRSTLKEVLNREPTMIELNETKGWNMERLLHYGGPNRITGSKLTIGNYSNIPERSLIDEREYEEDGVTKNPSYGKGLVFEKTPLSYARNKAGTIRVKGFSNQNYRELFSWGIGVTGSERMDEHFYINSTIESMVDNLIEQDHYTDR